MAAKKPTKKKAAVKLKDLAAKKAAKGGVSVSAVSQHLMTRPKAQDGQFGTYDPVEH